MRRRNLIAIGFFLLFAAAVFVLAYSPLRLATGLRNRILGKSSIEDRVREYGPAAEGRLKPRFEAAGLAYPPARLTILVLKQERELRVYALAAEGWREAARYKILGASGGPGPKLRQGDQQVPEGFYGVESLNPNSFFHVALRVDYPSAEDRTAAAADGRTGLGGDIMIHGGSASVGCIAIGNEAIEEVFVLAAKVGIGKVELIISPSADPRPESGAPAWLVDRYARLKNRIGELALGAGGA